MSDLTWLCDRCGQPVKPEDGGVRVTHAEILEHRRTEAAYDEAHAPGEAVELHEFLLVPPDIRWRPLHFRCDEERGDAYCIDILFVGTYRGICKWTAHLMAKNWLELTDWDHLLREVAGEIPSTRVVLAQAAA
jgi:hypothetical protein